MGLTYKVKEVEKLTVLLQCMPGTEPYSMRVTGVGTHMRIPGYKPHCFKSVPGLPTSNDSSGKVRDLPLASVPEQTSHLISWLWQTKASQV